MSVDDDGGAVTGASMGLRPADASGPRWAIVGFMAVLIFLQKLAFGFGDKQVSVVVPATYLLLAVLLWRGRLLVWPTRLLLFALFVLAASASQALVRQALSLPSFLALPILYFPLCCSAQLSDASWQELLNWFQRMMLVIAALVGLQFVTLSTLHWQPNLETVVPAGLLLQGYAYDIVRWGAGTVRPNGLVFLEPSFASIFLATAFVVELTLFRRAWHALAYFLALLSGQGASGLVILVVALPLLLARLRSASAIQLGLVGLLVASIVATTRLGTPLWSRIGELGTPATSGYLRISEPLQQLGDAFNGQRLPMDALGAGNAPIGDANAWPITKLGYEYGFVTAALLLALVVVSCWSIRLLPVLLPLLLVYNFTGGYQHNPVMVPLLFLFGALLRPPLEPAFAPVPRHAWSS